MLGLNVTPADVQDRATRQENEVGQAVLSLPESNAGRAARFALLRVAGRDIEALSAAAETVLRHQYAYFRVRFALSQPFTVP